jgi:hypothetical protein
MDRELGKSEKEPDTVPHTKPAYTEEFNLNPAIGGDGCNRK